MKQFDSWLHREHGARLMIFFSSPGGGAARSPLTELQLIKTIYKYGLGEHHTIQNAAHWNLFEVAAFLLEHERPAEGNLWEAFQIAIQKGYVRVLELLYDKLDQTGVLVHEYYYLAADNGHVHVLQYFHSRGVVLTTAFIARAAAHGHLEVIRYVLSQGVRLTGIFYVHSRALAAIYGHHEVVQFLDRQ